MSKSISRRRFLGTTAAVSAATFLPGSPGVCR
ncbi:twin-arginine translocation signal domain-containing protein [Primorskyibacter marinus]